MYVYFIFQTFLILFMCIFQSMGTAFDYTGYEERDIKKAATKFNITIGATTATASVLAHLGRIRPAQPALYLSTITALGNVLIIKNKVSAQNKAK